MNSLTPPLCAICGMRPATHVCQQCGRVVCSSCIDPVRLSCSECQAKLSSTGPTAFAGSSQIPLATWLFFIAFAVIFVGMLLMAFGSVANTGGVAWSGGAVIFIGPIPIILGSGPYSFSLVVLAGILTIAGFVFLIFMRKRF